jgi:hypothetical protein
MTDLGMLLLRKAAEPVVSNRVIFRVLKIYLAIYLVPFSVAQWGEIRGAALEGAQETIFATI